MLLRSVFDNEGRRPPNTSSGGTSSSADTAAFEARVKRAKAAVERRAASHRVRIARLRRQLSKATVKAVDKDAQPKHKSVDVGQMQTSLRREERHLRQVEVLAGNLEYNEALQVKLQVLELDGVLSSSTSGECEGEQTGVTGLSSGESVPGREASAAARGDILRTRLLGSNVLDSGGAEEVSEEVLVDRLIGLMEYSGSSGADYPEYMLAGPARLPGTGSDSRSEGNPSASASAQSGSTATEVMSTGKVGASPIDSLDEAAKLVAMLPAGRGESYLCADDAVDRLDSDLPSKK